MKFQKGEKFCAQWLGVVCFAVAGVCPTPLITPRGCCMFYVEKGRYICERLVRIFRSWEERGNSSFVILMRTLFKFERRFSKLCSLVFSLIPLLSPGWKILLNGSQSLNKAMQFPSRLLKDLLMSFEAGEVDFTFRWIASFATYLWLSLRNLPYDKWWLQIPVMILWWFWYSQWVGVDTGGIHGDMVYHGLPLWPTNMKGRERGVHISKLFLIHSHQDPMEELMVGYIWRPISK